MSQSSSVRTLTNGSVPSMVSSTTSQSIDIIVPSAKRHSTLPVSMLNSQDKSLFIYDTTYTYDFYDAGTYLDCSVGCYFGVVGASEPIWWSATTQVTIPNL